jgi:prepilin-type N-terminal cleavage/methylation domain-containing protein
MRKHKGFTVIELLLVVAIIAIIATIAAIAIPNCKMATAKKAKRLAESQEQSQVLQQAERSHILEQSEHKRRFTTSGLAQLDTAYGSYTYMILTDSEGGAQYLFMNPGTPNQIIVPLLRRTP